MWLKCVGLFCIPISKNENSVASKTSPEFVRSILDLGFYDKQMVVSQCLCPPPPPSGSGCGASSHMLVCHLCLFKWELQVLGPFKNGSGHFLTVEFYCWVCCTYFGLWLQQIISPSVCLSSLSVAFQIQSARQPYRVGCSFTIVLVYMSSRR